MGANQDREALIKFALRSGEFYKGASSQKPFRQISRYMTIRQIEYPCRVPFNKPGPLHLNPVTAEQVNGKRVILNCDSMKFDLY